MRTLQSACLALVAVLSIGVRAHAEPPAANQGKEVVVYMYSEYIDPELVKQFEQETGRKLRIDTYESSEEMLAKVNRAGGVKQYDVIVASDVVVQALVKANLVPPLDAAKIPNAKNVANDFKDPPFDRGSKYSMPYQWGTVGLMYRKDKVPPGQEISWAMIFEPDKQPGPCVLLDSMRDMLGVALKYQGRSMNSIDPQVVKAAGEAVIKAKKSPKCVGFEGGVGGKNKVLAGEAVAAISYNGDAIKGIADAHKENELGFAVPKEGGMIWIDVMVLTSQGPNPEGGYQFINFILDPANGAKLSNFNRYASPNQASLPMINKTDRENPELYPTPAMMGKLEYLKDLGRDTRLYDEVWTAVKSR